MALATGSVPFSLVFNTEPSLAAIHRYLDAADPFDEIRLTLFSHGVESVGLPTVGQWRSALDRATKVGSFLGVDERAFPGTSPPWPATTRPLPGSASITPCRSPSRSRSSTPSWTGRGSGTPSAGNER